MIIPATYEYAGFLYTIDGTLRRLTATPLPGQHPAANKERHRRAAVEQFVQDHGSHG